jgi:tetratricopeptide (TPR) repeat protein
VTITGNVSEPDTALDGAPVLQLYADQSAAGLSLHGMSGAPILVGTSEAEAAIGLVRWNPPRESDRSLAVGGILYACPIKAVIERRPELGQNLVEVSPPLEHQLHLVLRQLGITTVADALTRSVTQDDDRRKVATLIRQAEDRLKQAGQEANSENYFALGLLYATMGQLKEAEASLLAAITANPQMGKAYLGLATTYQLQANEMIRAGKYEYAEEPLKKSDEYRKMAFQYGFEDPMLQNQLGYVHKEFAQWYRSKVEEHLNSALINFKMVLGVDENDASAHNGIGNVGIVSKPIQKLVGRLTLFQGISQVFSHRKTT